MALDDHTIGEAGSPSLSFEPARRCYRYFYVLDVTLASKHIHTACGVYLVTLRILALWGVEAILGQTH